MAKKTSKASVSELPPALGEVATVTTVPAEVDAAPGSTIIEVPIGELGEGYLTRHVDVRLSSQGQREALRRLRAGLTKAGEKLQDGKAIVSYSDAVKWVLEEIAAGAPG